MGLKEYQRKRDFEKTSEPKGKVAPSPTGRIFVVQKHAARRLHYDLRLEMDGVLKSWAVPKGPSYDPAEKRLAVQVEDHPIDYGEFEGIIEPGEYGAGTVMLWDRGTWTPVGDLKKALAKGHLMFSLDGEKLKGIWNLVRIRGKEDEEGKTNWLLMKSTEDEAAHRQGPDVTEEKPDSVKTGRSLEEIKALREDKWVSGRPARNKQARPKKPSAAPAPPPGALKAPWPKSFFPQLATLVSNAPEGDLWISEIKFDGYRLLGEIRDGRVTLVTRRAQNWTDHFEPIAKELSRLPVASVILDGEIVVQEPDGTTNFQKLQNYLKHRRDTSLLYYVFDLPYLNGYNLCDVPLSERKGALRELIRSNQRLIPSVQYSDHLTGSARQVFHAACGHRAEGIVSKRIDSPYVQKRSKTWVKVKCTKRQEFVIGGYTDPLGSRTHFGSLLLGYYDDEGKLVYCGNVGTGFDESSIKAIYERLKRIEQDHSPFAGTVKHPAKKREIHWTSPSLVAEVEFTAWTDEGILRHPSFTGIREDKRPREVKLEREMPPPGDTEAEEPLPLSSLLPVQLSHPDKILYPDQGLTKKDLAEYYAQISRWMLPELSNRPLSLFRCPEGAEQECFFQKHLGEEAPEWIKTVPIQETGKVGLYPIVEDLNGLLSLVQLGVLEIHAWGCRKEHLEQPDRIVFDLDPSPEVPKERVIEATLFFKEWLLKNQLRAFLKTTGGKGIHVVVPLKPSMDWEQARKVSGTIAEEMVHQKPDWFLAKMTKSKRKGKIFLDYLRNTRGATSILPYSTRARPGAPVALPIFENELTSELLSNPPGIRAVIERLRHLKENPWEDI
jgi:bifunctional non-homologous end joining protein LigD